MKNLWPISALLLIGSNIPISFLASDSVPVPVVIFHAQVICSKVEQDKITYNNFNMKSLNKQFPKNVTDLPKTMILPKNEPPIQQKNIQDATYHYYLRIDTNEGTNNLELAHINAALLSNGERLEKLTEESLKESVPEAEEGESAPATPEKKEPVKEERVSYPVLDIMVIGVNPSDTVTIQGKTAEGETVKKTVVKRPNLDTYTSKEGGEKEIKAKFILPDGTLITDEGYTKPDRAKFELPKSFDQKEEEGKKGKDKSNILFYCFPVIKDYQEYPTTKDGLRTIQLVKKSINYVMCPDPKQKELGGCLASAEQWLPEEVTQK